MPRRIPLLITVWFVASLFFLGDLGKYADDYFLSRHDPVSRSPLPLPSLGALSFARPLNWLVMAAVARSLWLDDHALHLVNALAHGAVAALLAAVLLALGTSFAAAAATTALFLAYPAPYEVVLWPAALPIALGCSLMLAACLATVRLARREAAGRRSTGALVSIALLSFVIACLYEQCAAALIALPLLHRAASPADTAAWRRSLRVGLVVAASVAIYVALYWSTAPPQTRGMPSTLPAIDLLRVEIARMAHQIARRMALVDFGRGALALGIATLAAMPGVTVVVGVLAAFCAWLALRPASRETRPGRAPAALVALFGVVLFASCWLPVLAASGTPISSRLTYAPALGLSFVVAVVLDRLGCGRVASTAPARWTQRGATLVVVIALLAGCVAMVGVQAAYRARTYADAALGEALTRAVPEPAPQTVFLVLGDARQPVATGATTLDGELVSAISLPQSATPWIRWAYRRRDLFAAQPAPWGVRIADATAAGVRIVGLEPAFRIEHTAHPEGGVTVPWSHVVALRVDRDGGVHLESRAAVQPMP